MTQSRTLPAPPHSPADRGRRCVLALFAWVGVSLLGYFAIDPPDPLPASAPGNHFSAGRAREVMGNLLEGLGPHPAGSPEAGILRDRIHLHLEKLGFDPSIQNTYAVSEEGVAGRVQNILARRNGRKEGPVLLCMAHYDSVWAGPGVSDDLSGVAILLELARLQIEGRRADLPVVFLFTDAEEQGLVGAAGFMDTPLFEEVGLVLNFEARGGSGPGYMFETGEGNAHLIDLYGGCVDTPTAASFTSEIYSRLPNDTDFSRFRDAGIVGFNFAFIEDLHVYHTPLDDFDHLSLSSLQHEGDQAHAIMTRWLELGPVPAGEGIPDKVFGSLPGGWMLSYRVPTARLVALLSLLAVIWSAHRRVLLANTSWPQIRASLGIHAAAILIPIAISIVVGTIVRWASGSPHPWWAVPLPMVVLQAGLVLWTASRLASSRAVRDGGVALTVVTGIGWSLCAVFTALLWPGVSFLFVPPALFLAVVLLLAPADRYADVRLGHGLAYILPFAAYLWVPAQRGLAAAGGPGIEPTVLLPLVLLGTCSLPLWIGIPARLRLWLHRGALGLVILSVLGTLCVVPQSKDRPAKLNLVYVQSCEGGQGPEWQACSFGADLPEALQAAAQFKERDSRESKQGAAQHGESGGSLIPADAKLAQGVSFDQFGQEFELDFEARWPGQRVFHTPAPHLKIPPPQLEQIESEWVGRGLERALRVKATLRAGAQGGRTLLALQAAPCLARIGVGERRSGQSDTFAFLNVGTQGQPIELWFDWPAVEDLAAGVKEDGAKVAPSHQGMSPWPESDPIEILLVDQRPGLPPAGLYLQGARPPEFVPAHDGDGVMVCNRVALPWPATPNEPRGDQ